MAGERSENGVVEIFEEDLTEEDGKRADGLWQRMSVFQRSAVVAGAILLLAGGVVAAKLLSAQEVAVEVADTTGEEVATVSATPATAVISVDVEGAVMTPGVYELVKDSRVQAALSAAGGLSAKADRGWVGKNVNLAGKLIDGAKVYIPTTEETVEGVAVNDGGKQEAGTLGAQPVNINSATAAELDTLPGVGPATAGKIIGNRPYQAVEELVSKKVVSQRVFEGLREGISVY